MLHIADNKREIEKSVGLSKCDDDCIYCNSGLQHLCDAKRKIGAVSYLECLEKDPKICICSWFLEDWNSHICSCLSRIYTAHKLQRWNFSFTLRINCETETWILILDWYSPFRGKITWKIPILMPPIFQNLTSDTKVR